MNKWSRRGFITAGLIGAGALVVGVTIRPGNRAARLNHLVSNNDEMLLNAWVKLSTDNRITVIVPHCEMGQGVHTSLPMMLAEEMDVAWQSVDMLEAPDDIEYANYALAQGYTLGDASIPSVLVQTIKGVFLEATKMMKLQITGGSLSVRATGAVALQIAGASAREMLIKAAAYKWQVVESEVTTSDNFLYHVASQQKAPYAEFITEAANHTPSSIPKLKSVDQYKILGSSPPRLDIPAKVDGSAVFGIDANPDKLVYATVKSSPVFGEKLLSVDSYKTKSMTGVIKVIELQKSVAVVATGYWQALQGLNQLTIKWTESSTSNVSTQSLFKQFRSDLKLAVEQGNENIDKQVGDPQQALSDASKVIEAEYQQPYLAHAPMEPLNCTVEIISGKCQVWTGSQNPLGFRAAIADALDFDLDNVKVHNAYLGGGFGRRSNPDYAVQAALIAAKLDVPVKVIWSREEDIRQDHYRQASISNFKAGFDENGNPLVWLNQYIDKHEPIEAPHIPYNIAHQLITHIDSPTHIPFGPWRSVDHSLHAFFTESFIDEIANEVKKDAYQFRRELLSKEPRIRNVLDKVAEISNWKNPLSGGAGRGIAIHSSFNSIVAQVAEVSVTDGKIRVHKIYCVVDCGFAINPDGLKAQMEGGIIFGLTAALYGEITIDKGQVMESNFHDYPMVRMKDSPDIEVQIINSGESLGGGGEPGTPPVAPAVANAIFAATGKRIRQLPLAGTRNG